MQNLGIWQARRPAMLPDFSDARPEMTISQLIGNMAGNGAAIATCDEGQTLGIIDKARLLKGIKGEVR